jgi:glycosyltransferase involved in cell wall biosynthesis
VLPLPFPRVPDATPIGTTATDEPWIVTLGWVDPIKQPDLLIDAVARVRDEVPARLAFVGELASATHDELRARVRRLGLDDVVEFVGFTNDDEYQAWLQRAAVVVQLRASSRGEASAALNDAIAAGRATVTNVPTARELPTGVVEHLDRDDPEHLAALLGALLRDPDRRRALGARAQAHAREWTFEALATRVTEIVDALPAAAPTRR